MPVKPVHLSGCAAKEWDRLTGEMEAANIEVSVAHRSPLSPGGHYSGGHCRVLRIKNPPSEFNE